MDSERKKKIVLLASSMMSILAGATISPALPAISKAFHDTPHADTLVALVLTAPALAIAISGSFIGMAVDRFGRKPVLITATIVYGIAGSSGLYLDSLLALILGRVMLGFSVAAMVTATNTIVADYYNGVERQAFMGTQTSAIGYSGVFFLIGGGLLADISWRAPFAIYLSAYLLLPAIIYILHEPERILASKGGPRPRIARGTYLRIAGAYVLAFILMVTFYIIPVKLPFFLLELGESSAIQAGIAIAFNPLGMATTALFYQKLRRRFSVNNLFAISFLIMGTAFIILAYASVYPVVVIACTLNGIGFGIAMPNLNVWLASLAPASARGRIFGGLATAFFLGQFVSPILTAPVIASNGLGGIFGGFGISAIIQLAFFIGFATISVYQSKVIHGFRS